MISTIEQISSSSIEHLVIVSGVKFTAKDLEAVLPNNSTLELIGSEALARLLLERGIYPDISSAWDDVCKIKRFKAGMKIS